MNNIEKIGLIGGRPIYADTGKDQIQILQAEVKKRVERKELKPGQRLKMMVDFDRPLVIEITVHEIEGSTE